MLPGHAIPFSCNGVSGLAVPVMSRRSAKYWRATCRTVIDLMMDAPSVIETRLNANQTPSDQQRGAGFGPIGLVPAFGGSGIFQWLKWCLPQIKLAIWRYRLRYPDGKCRLWPRHVGVGVASGCTIRFGANQKARLHRCAIQV